MHGHHVQSRDWLAEEIAPTSNPFDELIDLKRKDKIKRRVELNSDEKRQERAVNYTKAKSPLVRNYLYVCYHLWLIQTSSIWNLYVFLCIVVAGLLVGIQTYPGMDENPVIIAIDTVVLYSFAAEIIFKIFSEGLSPYWFLLSKESRYWNIFDTVVVLACLPIIPIGAKQIAVLRLLRLARLGKLFRRIPQLQMIVSGLILGLKSIFYIVIIEILICYIFAVAGILFFRNNDVYHFRSIEIAFLSLLSVLTYDNWGDILYTNYYGCDSYGVSVLGYYTNIPSEDQGILGGTLYCSDPIVSTSNKILTIFWFGSFIFIAG